MAQTVAIGDTDGVATATTTSPASTEFSTQQPAQSFETEISESSHDTLSTEDDAASSGPSESTRPPTDGIRKRRRVRPKRLVFDPEVFQEQQLLLEDTRSHSPGASTADSSYLAAKLLGETETFETEISDDYYHSPTAATAAERTSFLESPLPESPPLLNLGLSGLIQERPEEEVLFQTDSDDTWETTTTTTTTPSMAIDIDMELESSTFTSSSSDTTTSTADDEHVSSNGEDETSELWDRSSSHTNKLPAPISDQHFKTPRRSNRTQSSTVTTPVLPRCQNPCSALDGNDTERVVHQLPIDTSSSSSSSTTTGSSRSTEGIRMSSGLETRQCNDNSPIVDANGDNDHAVVFSNAPLPNHPVDSGHDSSFGSVAANTKLPHQDEANQETRAQNPNGDHPSAAATAGDAYRIDHGDDDQVLDCTKTILRNHRCNDTDSGDCDSYTSRCKTLATDETDERSYVFVENDEIPTSYVVVENDDKLQGDDEALRIGGEETKNRPREITLLCATTKKSVEQGQAMTAERQEGPLKADAKKTSSENGTGQIASISMAAMEEPKQKEANDQTIESRNEAPSTTASEDDRILQQNDAATLVCREHQEPGKKQHDETPNACDETSSIDAPERIKTETTPNEESKAKLSENQQHRSTHTEPSETTVVREKSSEEERKRMIIVHHVRKMITPLVELRGLPTNVTLASTRSIAAPKPPSVVDSLLKLVGTLAINVIGNLVITSFAAFDSRLECKIKLCRTTPETLHLAIVID